jgi:hypothetical protein
MPQRFTGYWGGYFDSPLTLDLTPTSMDVVTLAFAGPIGNSTMETTYLCSKYDEETIISWARALKERGQKVTMSLLDTPETHWHVVDKQVFAESAYEIAIERWGLDGFDIDAESGMPDTVIAQNFVDLTHALRTKLGNKRILSYTCYTGISGPDGDILPKIQHQIDYVQLMAYFDDTFGMKSLFNSYATLFPPEKIYIGVKAGCQGTGLDEVAELCQWKKQTKGGVMLWTANRDFPTFTGRPPWTWAETIRTNL